MTESNTDQAPWPVLVVDDDPDMHAVTTLILEDVQYRGRALEFSHAHSAAVARAMLAERTYALALLDVVMETDNAGLELVKHLRSTLDQQHTRIIIRTGQAGTAPEWLTVTDYDINGYEDKSMATAQRLRTAVVTALRTYDQIAALANANSRIARHVAGLQALINTLSKAEPANSTTLVNADVLDQLRLLVADTANSVDDATN